MPNGQSISLLWLLIRQGGTDVTPETITYGHKAIRPPDPTQTGKAFQTVGLKIKNARNPGISILM